jgi:hypothetical protein
MKNEPEDIGHERKVEQAFIESENHSFNGLKLEPWSPERMWAAESMGLRYGKLSKETVPQFQKTYMYNGMTGDVGIFIWLSTRNIDEVRAARRDPDTAEELAGTFAKENGIIVASGKHFNEAYKLFLQAMDEIYVSSTELDSEKKTATAT